MASDSSTNRPGDGDRRGRRPAEADLEAVRVALEGVRFGEVRLIIQDGVIVQIERVEKRRLR